MDAKVGLKESIKLVLDQGLMVYDGFVTLYWTSMGSEDDPNYIVCSDETLKEMDQFYEEFEEFDDAYECFLKHAGIDHG